jgi:hypothetical protein
MTNRFRAGSSRKWVWIGLLAAAAVIVGVVIAVMGSGGSSHGGGGSWGAGMPTGTLSHTLLPRA